MKPIFFGCLLIASAIFSGCDLLNGGKKIDLGGCWQVIDTTMGEVLFVVDTGSLELTQSGQSINGYVSWSKSDFHPSDSVVGTLVGDLINLKLFDAKTKDTLALNGVAETFAGVAKNDSTFETSWRGPESAPFTTPTRDWAGTRISCRTGK